LSTIYRSPSDNADEFIAVLDEFLGTLKTSRTACFDCGEFNINLNVNDKKLRQVILNKVLSFGFAINICW
jgi:hypothetical protein